MASRNERGEGEPAGRSRVLCWSVTPAVPLSPTPGILVHIDNLRWEGVPFILMSGKALDERVSYVRILFKNQAFCVQSEKHWVAAQSHCLPRQIIFYIGHGELGSPAVLVSRNLFQPALPSASWKEVEGRPGLHLFGLPLSDYYAYSPVREQDAYSLLTYALQEVSLMKCNI